MKSSNDILLVGGFQEMIELCEECGMNIVGIIDRLGGALLAILLLVTMTMRMLFTPNLDIANLF